MFSYIVCSIIGHKLVEVGECPFTGKTYDLCKRCTKMIEVNNV